MAQPETPDLLDVGQNLSVSYHTRLPIVNETL